jgi:hypothetical protein
MLNKGHFAAIVIAFCLAAPASADQAAYISKADADRAVKLLNNVATIKSYCAPCGDATAETMAVNDIKEVDVNYEGYWEIQINGQGVDLAYIYFPENKKWRNVAMALNIPVQDVPEFID